MVKIYAIVNPLNDDVLYIGASKTPALRYCQHLKGVTWPDYTYRHKELVKLKEVGVKPELLILDNIPFPYVPFFEEFYMQLFKSWGYKITQQSRSGYQTNKRFLEDGKNVFVFSFKMHGTVTEHIDQAHPKIYFPETGRTMSIFINDIAHDGE